MNGNDLDGIFAPGNSPGKATFSSNQVFTASNTLEIEVDGNIPETEHDLVEVNDNVTISGTLAVSINYIPTANDRIVFLTATSISGTFGSISPTLPVGWQVDYSVAGEVALQYSCIFYADSDGDGFGDPAVSISGCAAPNGYVADNTDCNDSDADEFPGQTWYPDGDNDGYRGGAALIGCERPSPGHKTADELINTTDIDCNDGDPTVFMNQTWLEDADDDGYYSGNLLISCNRPAGFKLATELVNTTDVDCDDNDAAVHPGALEICGDGLDNDCDGTIDENDCAGYLFTTCSRIESGDGDAEEGGDGSVSLSSSDLELVDDGGLQTVGMRFAGLGIPQGAIITNAYIQFTVDEDGNIDPCNLTIHGQASDDAPPFSGSDNDITGRTPTNATMAWAPPNWAAVGDAGPAQQTPDISTIIQEIVSRSNYTTASSIAIIIDGTGKRVAESYDGSSANAPELCVEYIAPLPAFDCPNLSANIGDSCDDGDDTNINDTVDADCNCFGTPTSCTGIGDADGDNICDNVDNCVSDFNPGQEDLDQDGLGDACDQSVCINTVVDNLKGYVNGLSISSSIKSSIARRLDLAASKFCSGYSASTVISSLNYVISYVQYQSGSGIPVSAANYILAQVNGLIAALNAGIVVCCQNGPSVAPLPGPANAPEGYRLEASPNPFRHQVALRFSLPRAGQATLEVLNLNGQRVQVLEEGLLDAGQHERAWDGTADNGQQLDAGVYVVRLRTADTALAKKVILVK